MKGNRNKKKEKTERKSAFFLRKLNFKLKPCNHHIKGLPFFRQPLVCGVDARAVFSIRFLCFFSWSGKLTYNRLNTRCSLERSIAANCIYQKHSLGLFTLCDLIKRSSCWECFSDCTWIEENSKPQVQLPQPHEEGPHLNSITVICLSLQLIHGIFVRQFFPCWLVWWGCDCSRSLSHFSRINQAYKSCRSYPHWPFHTPKFTHTQLVLSRKKSHIPLEANLLAHIFFLFPTAGFIELCHGFSKRGGNV